MIDNHEMFLFTSAGILWQRRLCHSLVRLPAAQLCGVRKLDGNGEGRIYCLRFLFIIAHSLFAGTSVRRKQSLILIQAPATKNYSTSDTPPDTANFMASAEFT